MIYLVSNSILADSNKYKRISVEESLTMLKPCKVLQFDTETNGRDAHINKLLCIQFGNDEHDFQIVVDVDTIDILFYKEELETKLIIGQNLKFDLQFLYNYKIIPTKVYDTMIVEQLLYLGYPYGVISYSLKSIADRYLGVNIDKTVRGQIIWRGLDEDVIVYAAGDVTYLEKIMFKQFEQCRIKNCFIGAKLECDFVPVIAYLEWCGIKLDIAGWKHKMELDQKGLEERKKALDNFIVTNNLTKYYTIDRQGDLFEGYNTDPIITINWDSSKQVVNLAKELGFNTTVQDKKTGQDKDSVLEKQLKGQKGINDEFLKLYFAYKESSKVCSTYGQGHLNAVNPKTGRIHTVYKQLGAASGRMSCGSNQPNTDLAKLKKLLAKECTYPNIQQLPADDITRSCFVSDIGNSFVSCDYSALESRLGADIYQEPAMIEEYLHGSGDIHSLVAKACFPKELDGIEVKDIKKLRPDLRKKAKGPEFAMQFGGSSHAIASSLGCSLEEADEIAEAYWKGFSGIAKFKAEGSRAVRKNGYVLMCPITGHKMYWWDHKKWVERQKTFTQAFWEEYRSYHKGTGDAIALEVKEHFQAASKWDRMALNSVTQGTGVICLKDSMITLFKWILNNNLFNKVKIVALVHDEACIEFPKEMIEFPNFLAKTMQDSAAKYCKSVPIPAEAEVGTHWIH